MGQYANKKPITAALEFDQYERLEALSKETRIPMQQYLREGVDMVLVRYDATATAPAAEVEEK